MPRQALLVGNSITFRDLTKSVTKDLIKRTLTRLERLLTDLDSSYAFGVEHLIDGTSGAVLRQVEKSAAAAATSGDIFLFYYFGHGALSSELQLLLKPDDATTGPLELASVESRVVESHVPKSLFVLDCCYSGAVARTFSWGLKGQHCRLASTVATSLAYVTTNRTDAPIGAFTAAMMEGFTSSKACVSSTDDSVTAESLFRYAKPRTKEISPDQEQEPVMEGYLPDVLFEYRSTPRVQSGYSTWASKKTGYAKLLAICRVLASSRRRTLITLHKVLVTEYRDSFRTLFKRDDERFEYIDVSIQVVGRYVGLLRRLNLISGSELKLTERGRLAATHWKGRYNELLLAAIDDYLRVRGVAREDFVTASRRVLHSRRVPSGQEIIDLLVLGGHHLPRGDATTILDLLGYAGAIGVADRRAYFPWS